MKKKILIIVILVLVFSFFVIPSTLALYRSITSPNGDVALAEWDVSLDQDDIDNYISITPGDNGIVGSYTLNVKSLSQVDIIYTVVVEDLEPGISVAIDDGEFIAAVNNKVIFADIGNILYSSQNKTNTHTIRFKAAAGTELVDEKEVNINVIARQELEE